MTLWCSLCQLEFSNTTMPITLNLEIKRTGSKMKDDYSSINEAAQYLRKYGFVSLDQAVRQLRVITDKGDRAAR